MKNKLFFWSFLLKVAHILVCQNPSFISTKESDSAYSRGREITECIFGLRLGDSCKKLSVVKIAILTRLSLRRYKLRPTLSFNDATAGPCDSSYVTSPLGLLDQTSHAVRFLITREL